MTACRLTCDDCGGEGRPPRVWRESCVECAEEVSARHQRETGHRALHLAVTEPPTPPELLRRITRSRSLRRWTADG